MFDVLRPVFGRGTSVTPASGRKRGPKPAYSKWAALIEAVVILERTGRLKQAYAGPGKLLEELQLQVPEDLQLDDRTIEPVVSYIYDRILSSA